MTRSRDRDIRRSRLRHLRGLVVTTMLVVVFVVSAMCQGGTMPSPCSGITKISEKVVGTHPQLLAATAFWQDLSASEDARVDLVPPSPLGALSELIGSSSTPLRV